MATICACGVLSGSLRADLISRLTFDSTLEDIGPGANDGVYVGAEAPTYVEGRDGTAGGAILFNDGDANAEGPDDYVVLTPNSGLPLNDHENFTVAMWVKGPSQDDKRVFSEGSDSNGRPLFNLGVRNSEAVNSFLRFDAGGPGHRAGQLTAFDDTWHHIAWSDANGDVTLYVDGVEDPTNLDYTRSALTVNQTSIGAILRDSVCCQFAGAIDDVQLFDHALSQEEVRDVIEDGACTAETETACLGVSLVAGPAENVIGRYTFMVDAGAAPEGATLSYEFMATNADDGRVKVAGPSPETTAEFLLEVGTWTVTATVATAGDLLCWASCESDPVVIAPPARRVAYWPLDGDLMDMEPSANHGEVVFNPDAIDPVLTFTEGFDGTADGAVLFNDDYLISAMQNGGLPIYGNVAYTVAMWVKGPAAADGVVDRRVFSEGSTTSSNPLLNLGTSTTVGSSKMEPFIRVGGNLLGHPPTDRDVFDDTWHHVTWVDDGGDGTIYIDGVRDANFNDLDYTKPFAELNTTTIGGILRGGPSHYFVGAIDDVQLFNYALSASEVRELIPEPDTCPDDGDTRCLDFDIAGPDGNVFGDYTITVNAEDDSGDAILYTVLAESLEGEVLQSGPSTSNVHTLNLTATEWTIRVLVDDELLCGDELAAASCPSETLFVFAQPPRLITHLDFEGDFVDKGDAGNDAFILGDGDVPFDFGYDCGGAASFDGTNFLGLTRTSDVPIANLPEYSIAMWVKGDPQPDKRVFSEGSTTNNNPLFNIGTDNTGATGAVDVFLRNGGNIYPEAHRKTEGVAFDGTWHHIVWTYNEGTAAVWIDGVRDPVDFSFPPQDWPTDTTTIGGIQRGGPCCQYTGLIDDVRIYNFVLQEAEIAELVGDGPSELCCPDEGDTTCSGVSVASAPALMGPGTWTFEASAQDDSGDAILYTFTADNGVDEPMVLGPQEERAASFNLSLGTWSITVEVDDDPECDDVAEGNTCTLSDIEVIECDTTCDDLQLIASPPDNIPGEYTFDAAATSSSGAPVLYTFTADNGTDDPMIIGPTENNFVNFELTTGHWFVSVSVDDDPRCDSEEHPTECLIELDVADPRPIFLRGDVDGNGVLDVTDPIGNLTHQFLGGFNVLCLDAHDFDDNGLLDVSDPIANLTHQFLGGPAPPPPGKEVCGIDPTEDDASVGGDLGCEAFPAATCQEG